MLAVIGGSGLARLASLERPQSRTLSTPYGDASVTSGRIAGREALFLARHGEGHTLAPHEINYRANIRALKDCGASEVIAVATVGAIRSDLGAGALLVPRQIIDYTWGRPSTFFEGPGAPVTHVDFTHPYSQALRARILAAAAACGEQVRDGGVYAATQGPRLETAAEIDRLERDGADVVGMTGMPEAILAREAGLEYAALAVAVNTAAGRGESARAISLERIAAVLEEAMERVRRIIERLART